MKIIDWGKYRFRASQMHKLMVGTLLPTTEMENEISALQLERDTLTNANGRKVKWTQSKQETLDAKKRKLEQVDSFDGLMLPKTLSSELRKIHRAVTYGRDFEVSTKYTVKGVRQEEEAITNYQTYLNAIGRRTLFTKNTERLTNEWASGEPDLWKKGDKIGFDTKCSWELETFPFKDDDLDPQYEAQNQTYMWLTGADEWITAYCLVNLHEHGLNNEKLKVYYALECPDEEHKYYSEYIKKCKKLERRLIFDYDRFVDAFPYHQILHTREEWMDNGYDIPLEERIIEKKSIRSDEFQENLKERIKIAREYLKNLK